MGTKPHHDKSRSANSSRSYEENGIKKSGNFGLGLGRGPRSPRPRVRRPCDDLTVPAAYAPYCPSEASELPEGRCITRMHRRRGVGADDLASESSVRSSEDQAPNISSRGGGEALHSHVDTDEEQRRNRGCRIAADGSDDPTIPFSFPMEEKRKRDKWLKEGYRSREIAQNDRQNRQDRQMP
jgi:hypothetical protein